MKKTIMIIMVVFSLMAAFASAETKEVCIDMNDPSIPTDLNLDDKVLTWGASTDSPDCSGISHYEIYVDDILSGRSSDLSYDMSRLPIGTYEISVVAVDEASNKGPAATITLEITESSTSVPSTPSTVSTTTTTVASSDGGDGDSGSNNGGGGGGYSYATTTTSPSTTTTTNNLPTVFDTMEGSGSQDEDDQENDGSGTTDDEENSAPIISFEGDEETGGEDIEGSQEKQAEGDGLMARAIQPITRLGRTGNIIGIVLLAGLIAGGIWFFAARKKKSKGE